MNEYFVCFLDLLGFSNLTKDISKSKKTINILSDFHRIVKNEIKDTSIKYLVISDSLFLIADCKSFEKLAFSLSEIFRECIENGILLRAGLAYGECNFKKTALLNKNIFGKAVTDSVTYEKKGKGCRIFTDTDIQKNTSGYSRLFKESRNFVDYSFIDTFEWCLMNKKKSFFISEQESANDEENLKHLLSRNYHIMNALLHSPKYSWNMKSKEGECQLFSTAAYISDSINYIQTLLEQKNYEQMKIISESCLRGKRLSNIVERLNSRIDNSIFQEKLININNTPFTSEELKAVLKTTTL